MKIFLTISCVILVTLVLLGAPSFLKGVNLTMSQVPFINDLLKYQILALSLALVVLMVTLKVSPDSKQLLSFGNLQVLAVKERWLGINGLSSWKSNAIQLGLIISCATAVFMYLAVKYTPHEAGLNWSFVPFIIVISLSNSLSEELIFRFAVNGNLSSLLTKTHVLLISAILFGWPHYFGFPSGIIGIIMAGVLGYVLSKASYETQGLGIAWTIHFLQDIIIFTAIFMMK